jgi:hypothetical protein
VRLSASGIPSARPDGPVSSTNSLPGIRPLQEEIYRLSHARQPLHRLADGRKLAHESCPEQFHSIGFRDFFERPRERLCGPLFQREALILKPIVQHQKRTIFTE